MGIARAQLAFLGMGLLLAGCSPKSSGGGGGPDVDAAFDGAVSFDSPSGDDSSITDSTTADSAIDSGTQDTSTTVDSSTGTESGTDSGLAMEAGSDAAVEGGCGPTMCAQAAAPDGGMYTSTCNATCNTLSVNCTCASDTADQCFCAIGNAAPSCLAGSLSDCGDQAFCSADLTTDPLNCGRCGHSCGSLTCSGGVCQERTLSFGMTSDAGGSPLFPDDWASDGTFIYGASCYGNLIFKIPVGGVAAAAVPTMIATGQNCPTGIAIDSTNAYWVNGGNGTVWTAPLSGSGTATQIGTFGLTWFSSPNAWHGVAVDSSHVYFDVQPSSGYGSVFSLLKTGGTPQVLSFDGTILRASVVVDASNVYYLTFNGADGQLRSVPKTNLSDAGIPSTILATFTGDQVLDFVQVPSGTFYVSGVPLGGGTPTIFAQGFLRDYPETLVTDGTTVFWTDFINGYVYEKPIAGGYAQQMAIGLTEPFFMLLDANNIYWTSNYGGYFSLPKAYRP